MRTFVILLAAVTASLTASAYAGTVNLSIHSSGSKVLYGHQLTLSGRLSSGLARQKISVYSKPFGIGPTRIATVRTGPNGGWSIQIEPAIATTYQAHLGSTASRAVTVGVAPAITTRPLSGGVWAHVAGGTTFVGRKLQLQRWAGGHWMTVATMPLNGSSDALFQAPISRGNAMLRLALSVNQAGAGFLGAATHPFAFRAMTVSAAVSGTAVRFGHGLTLRGRISSHQSGQKVVILARPYGTSAPVALNATLTRAGGRWTAHVKPTIRTAYRADWNGVESRAIVVGVRPVLTANRLADGRLVVTAAPLGTFAGRSVQLQRLVGGAWHTVDRMTLSGPNGRAVFPAPVKGGRASLRVAMSVNEAGAGFLGVVGRALAYHAHAVSIAPSTFKALYGHSIVLAGNVSSGRSGQRVTVFAWPYGRSSAGKVATVRTGPGGRWTFSAKPSVQTTYTASWGPTRSRSIIVGVEPRVTVAVLGDGRIAVHLATRRPLAGRTVQLQQQLAANAWTTVKRMRLNDHAVAVFPALAASGSPTMRVAISVNASGAGLLGARSHPFVYHSV